MSIEKRISLLMLGMGFSAGVFFGIDVTKGFTLSGIAFTVGILALALFSYYRKL